MCKMGKEENRGRLFATAFGVADESIEEVLRKVAKHGT